MCRPRPGRILFSFLARAGVLIPAIAASNAVSRIGLKLFTEGIGTPMASAPAADRSGRRILAEVGQDRGQEINVIANGGYVRRRKAMPAFAGKYILADWSRSMAIPDGTLRVATIPSGNAAGPRWTVEPLALKESPNGRIKSSIWALGEDVGGELCVFANGLNSAFGTRGKVFNLVPQ